MSTTIPTPIEKCKGAMIATAIGDALGWPNEPRSKNRAKEPKVNGSFVEWMRSCSNPRYHDERILPGEYSDDTQMTLSVARSIIAGDWEKFFANKELPFWLKYERGGGGALLKAAKSISEKKVQLWQSSYTKIYFDAGGNGAAMRILPHVIAAASKPDITALMLNVHKDTLITHGHPRAFLGATCYAYALDYILRKETVLEYGELVSAVIEGEKYWGASPDSEMLDKWLPVAYQTCGYDYAQVWETTCRNMMHKLEFIKTSLKKGLMSDDTNVLRQLECFEKVNGAGDVAALAAIYLASRYANSPALGIKVPAFSFGADTDTIASITGGLLGMLSGTNWIPAEWKVVQDYECLVRVTELLLSENRKEATRAVVSEAREQDSSWKSSPIGVLRLMDTKEVPNGKRGVVIINKWRTILGQTIYMKDFRPTDIRPHQYNQSGVQMRLDIQSQPTVTGPKPPRADVRQALMFELALQPSMIQKRQRQFAVDSVIINTLFAKPEFKGKTTIGKVLKVIQALLESDDSAAAIASRFELDEGMVNLIKMCVK